MSENSQEISSNYMQNDENVNDERKSATVGDLWGIYLYERINQ